MCKSLSCAALPRDSLPAQAQAAVAAVERVEMESELNQFGQPVGEPVPGWSPRPPPPRTAMAGRFCTVRPLDPERARRAALRRLCRGRRGRMWTYLPRGPYRLSRRIPAHGPRPRAAARRPADAYDHRPRERRGGRHRRLYAHRSGDRRHRGRQHHLQPAPAASAGRHRGDVSDDAPRLRRARLPPLRVEMQLAERAVARRRGCGSASVTRGCSGRRQIDRGRNRDTTWFSIIDTRMAGVARRLRALARPGQFRCRRDAAPAACRASARRRDDRCAGAAVAGAARGGDGARLLQPAHGRAGAADAGRRVRRQRRPGAAGR